MKVADFIVKKLIEYGVTDAFGIPGGVVLRLINAMKEMEPEITPHLCYHEQMAGFAACGYAQASGRLGVAYATRGPGILNMVTSIAEAYQESIPVLFITAHGNRTNNELRFEYNQEIDVVAACEKFTKYAANIETIEDVSMLVDMALKSALDGRKGPVLLDFATTLFDKEITEYISEKQELSTKQEDVDSIAQEIGKKLSLSNRPIVLIGDGLRYTENTNAIIEFFTNMNIPIISSRGSQDLAVWSSNYFGYVGSHGVRYANFILSKADLIIAIGNRLAFPIQSESFGPIFQNATLIRLDVDDDELKRNIPNSINYLIDVSSLGEELNKISQYCSKDFNTWIKICREIKNELFDCDCTQPVTRIADFIKCAKKEEVVYVCDVGNNEFWFSRAFEKEHPYGQVLCSKSFGTLGVAIGRAIGAYYATRKRIICVIGDQGFQYNVQELQYISQWKLSICVVVINNEISGMICDHEKKSLKNSIHVSKENGYMALDVAKIAKAYGIPFANEMDELNLDGPMIFEIMIDKTIELTPTLPKGRKIQNMYPDLDCSLEDKLNGL
ncbi:MAG: thiamine pyrophosphate-binding protein [Lachnospiraceae bacterium]|nr:thiamine pyrophosphate-binding protein [Lachnospiraceae bacterium]